MRKIIKRAIATILSFLMIFGCIPMFANDASADSEPFIYVTPLVNGTKFDDIEFYGGGDAGACSEKITDIVWYNTADLSQALTGTDTIAAGNDYVVSMIWNKRLLPISNGDEIVLYDACRENPKRKISSAKIASDADILTKAMEDKKGYFKNLTEENTEDKKVVFYIDGTTDSKDIILKSACLDLKLFASPIGVVPTEDNLTQIEWSDIFEDGFDLNRLRIGKMAKDAMNNGKCFSIDSEENENEIMDKGEFIDLKFSYKDSPVTPRIISRVTVNGHTLFPDEYGYQCNDSNILTYYTIDEGTYDIINFKVEDVLDEIDSVKVCDAYTNALTVSLEIYDEDFEFNEEDIGSMAYTLDLAIFEGNYTKEEINSNPIAFNYSFFSNTQFIPILNYEISEDNKKLKFEIMLNQVILEDKDYTYLLSTFDPDNNKMKKTYIGTFRPTVKNTFDISVRDMKKGESLYDWFDETMSCCIVQYMRFNSNIHWENFDILCFDEIKDVENFEDFNDDTKLNITFWYSTTQEPTSMRLVKGNSDYQEVTLTRNEEFNNFTEKSLLGYAENEYDEMIAKYQGFENQYNYKLMEENRYPFPMYEVIAKVTLNFAPQTSHSTKKYKATTVSSSSSETSGEVKETNLNKDYQPKAETISGSGKKGSTRTITTIEGREVSNIIAVDAKNNPIELTKNEDGTYSFIQPASNVNIEVVYKDKEIVLDLNSTNASVYGKPAELDVKPRVVNDRTCLPARFIMENLECDVEWDAKNPNKVEVNNKDYKIEITIGSNIVLVNGKPVEIDVNAFVDGDRTFLPARFIAEIFGCTVSWNDNKPSEVRIVQSFK